MRRVLVDTVNTESAPSGEFPAERDVDAGVVREPLTP